MVREGPEDVQRSPTGTRHNRLRQSVGDIAVRLSHWIDSCTRVIHSPHLFRIYKESKSPRDVSLGVMTKDDLRHRTDHSPSPVTRSRRWSSRDIFDALKSEIVSGRRPLRSRFPNGRDLATQFGVSQPTLWEAVRALELLGFVDVRHGSGIYVTDDLANAILLSLGTILEVESADLSQLLLLRKVQILGSISVSAPHSMGKVAPELWDSWERASAAALDWTSLIRASLDVQSRIVSTTSNALLLNFERAFSAIIAGTLSSPALDISEASASWQSDFRSTGNDVLSAFEAGNSIETHVTMSHWCDLQELALVAATSHTRSDTREASIPADDATLAQISDLLGR